MKKKNNLIYKDVPDSNGYYCDSNGAVYGKLGEIKQYLGSNGYLTVKIALPWRKNRRHSSHRILMLSFFGKSKLHVNHKNGIKTDNRIENLEYVTPRQNSIHSVENNLRKLKVKKDMHQDLVNIFKTQGLADVCKKYGISDHHARQLLKKLMKGSYRKHLNPSHDKLKRKIIISKDDKILKTVLSQAEAARFCGCSKSFINEHMGGRLKNGIMKYPKACRGHVCRWI